MSTAENKRLLQHIYEELSQGNVQTLLDHLAEDVRWTTIGTTALSGTFRGKQEVIDKLLKPLRARLGGPIVFAVDRLTAEEDVVVMEARGRATSAKGRPYNNTYCIVARIAGGKLVEMTDYVDTELVTQALIA